MPHTNRTGVDGLLGVDRVCGVRVSILVLTGVPVVLPTGRGGRLGVVALRLVVVLVTETRTGRVLELVPLMGEP